MNQNYFNTSKINNTSPEWSEITEAAKKRFEGLKKEGKEIWLIYSRYYNNEGYIIQNSKPFTYATEIIDHYNPKKSDNE